MASQEEPPQNDVIFTANGLRDGRVVWLARAGQWVTDIAAAEPFPAAATAVGQALAKAAEAQQLVVGAYAVELAAPGRPVRFRERLRAAGPSVA